MKLFLYYLLFIFFFLVDKFQKKKKKKKVNISQPPQEANSKQIFEQFLEGMIIGQIVVKAFNPDQEDELQGQKISIAPIPIRGTLVNSNYFSVSKNNLQIKVSRQRFVCFFFIFILSFFFFSQKMLSYFSNLVKIFKILKNQKKQWS